MSCWGAGMQEGLIQNRAIASKIFAFTDSIPGATIGAAYQTITLKPDSLIGTMPAGHWGARLTDSCVSGCAVTSTAIQQERYTVSGADATITDCKQYVVMLLCD